MKFACSRFSSFEVRPRGLPCGLVMLREIRGIVWSAGGVHSKLCACFLYEAYLRRNLQLLDIFYPNMINNFI